MKSMGKIVARSILSMGFAGALMGAVQAQETPLNVEPSIHPELEQHTEHFAKTVYKVDRNVYSIVGWSLANTVVVEGEDGLIIVDPGGSLESGQEVLPVLREQTDKPVVAVVYTHFHPDHWGAVKAFVTEEEVREGKVDIYAHETLVDNVVRQGGLVGPILAMRTGYSFGLGLPAEDIEGMNGGIGPQDGGGRGTFIAPTKTFTDELTVTIAGVEMHFLHVPSEAPDEIAIHLPANNILLSAETIQGPTLPNIHTIRGTKFRDPVQWVKSIDRLRALKATHMVPSHGQPVYTAEKVEEVLRMTRDGIQFVHDQTVRHMNKGLTPDELAGAVSFPPHLDEYAPYLRQYYGTVKHATRQIYNGYLGWFQGDPVGLDPVAPVESARRLVELMGGREPVLAAAKTALDQGDDQWAAELATYLIRVSKEDQEARAIKAAAFRRLGYASMNINWRNWYLVSAMELEGKIDPQEFLKQIGTVFSSPDVVAQWPACILVEGMSPRLKAEETLDVELTAGFQFTDTEEACGLEIRKGVAQYHPTLPDDTDVTLKLTKAQLLGVGAGQISLAEAVGVGDIVVEGEAESLRTFFSFFESPAQEIWLTLR